MSNMSVILIPEGAKEDFEVRVDECNVIRPISISRGLHAGKFFLPDRLAVLPGFSDKLDPLLTPEAKSESGVSIAIADLADISSSV